MRHPGTLAELLSIKELSARVNVTIASIVWTKEIEKFYLIVEVEQDNE